MKRRTKLFCTAALGLGALALTLAAINSRRDSAMPISLKDPNSEDAVDRCLVRIAVESGSLTVRTVAAPHELMGHLRRFTESNNVALFMGTTAVVDVTGCVKAAGLQDHVHAVPEYEG